MLQTRRVERPLIVLYNIISHKNVVAMEPTMDLNEEQLDAIVEEIKKPITDLDSLLAELTMAHAYFEVVTTLAIHEGITDSAQIKQRILESYDAFREANPIPQVASH